MTCQLTAYSLTKVKSCQIFHEAKNAFMPIVASLFYCIIVLPISKGRSEGTLPLRLAD